MGDEYNLPDFSGPDSDIVDRIKQVMRVMNLKQVHLAQKLDVDPATVSRMVKRVLPPSDGLINKMVVNLGLSKSWLTDGVGNMFHDGAGAAIGQRIRPQGAPVYNIDVTAGSTPLSRMFTDEHVIGYVNLPGINPELPIVRVSGDSMVPRISNGAYLAIRQMNPASAIVWGQIYVVVLPDLRVVKYVRRHPDPDKVILQSANPAYDDIEIKRSDIEGLYVVENIINYEFT